MTVVYALVGYSKATERMVFRETVPPDAVPVAKKIAHLLIEDDTQSGDWELQPAQARDIAGLVNRDVNLSAADFFLEPYVIDGGAWPERV